MIQTHSHISQVHHVTRFDAGFYNCTAENVDGMATCTSEVVVDQPKVCILRFDSF